MRAHWARGEAGRVGVSSPRQSAPAARLVPAPAGRPLGCRCRPPPPAMVHAGPPPRLPSRAMFFRDTAAETKPRRVVSPLGIPKSPSFHSGLDLVASADSQSKRVESGNAVSEIARAFRLALFGGKEDDMNEPQGGLGKVPSPPDAKTPPPPPARISPDKTQIAPTDRESLMVQLPMLKGTHVLVSIEASICHRHALSQPACRCLFTALPVSFRCLLPPRFMAFWSILVYLIL